MTSNSCMRRRARGRDNLDAFTLVELLVVIGIIAVLVGILLPVMARARSQATSLKCISNLRQIAQGLVLYSLANKGCIVPSYNLPALPGAATNVTGGPNQPLDGWACILDRDKFVSSREQDANTMFYCPDTYDVDGMRAGQTADNAANQRGWTDWPLIFTVVGGDGVAKQATTIPDRGFNKIIRVGYWINSYNPIGSLPAKPLSLYDTYYTTSVGFGPDATGDYLHAHKTTNIRHSSLTITVADGLYMGRQSVTQMGMTNSRIAFRHPGPKGRDTMANVAFADGHAEAVGAFDFPCGYATTSTYTTAKGKTTLDKERARNFSGLTVYPNPESAWQAFNVTNPGAS